MVRRRARRRRVEAERTRVRAEALFAPPVREAEPSVQVESPQPPVASWRQRASLAVADRVPLWVRTRCGVERRGAVALALLVGVVALFAVQHFWAGRTQPVRAPEQVRAAAPRAVAPPDAGAAPPGASSAVSAPAASGATGIVVDVSGKVRRPGIHRLPAGARVADALRAAGGLRPGVDTAGLNRARLL
ncbi:SLBB domain-containing protein, partial [Streptomyces sp. CC224E]|uniref:SLBB domain-containing protein n=1 Tax=Streptomyces sp. CC224E TaxID=3044174 RepID=UPI00278C3214